MRIGIRGLGIRGIGGMPQSFRMILVFRQVFGPGIDGKFGVSGWCNGMGFG